MAEALKRSVSTISEEIRLGQIRGQYHPDKAHHKAYVRRWKSKYQGMKIVSHPALQNHVEKQLYDDQSPDNIAGQIREHKKNLASVSKNSIYRYIKSVYGRRVEHYRNKRKR